MESKVNTIKKNYFWE